MNLEYQTKRDELERKKKFFEDQQNINEKLDKEVSALDQLIADLSIRLTRDEMNRQQFKDEVIEKKISMNIFKNERFNFKF